MPDAFNDTSLFHIIAIYGFKLLSIDALFRDRIELGVPGWDSAHAAWTTTGRISLVRRNRHSDHVVWNRQFNSRLTVRIGLGVGVSHVHSSKHASPTSNKVGFCHLWMLYQRPLE